MQGRHETSVWTIAAWIARGPGSGEVAHSRVGPKMPTTGTSTAAARCIAPESFDTNARHRDSTPASAGRSVLPAEIDDRARAGAGGTRRPHDGVDRVAIGGSADEDDARARLMRQAGGEARPSAPAATASPTRTPRRARRRPGACRPTRVRAAGGPHAARRCVVHPHLGDERARRESRAHA